MRTRAPTGKERSRAAALSLPAERVFLLLLTCPPWLFFNSLSLSLSIPKAPETLRNTALIAAKKAFERSRAFGSIGKAAYINVFKPRETKDL
jgi:hypothetical protein